MKYPSFKPLYNYVSVVFGGQELDRSVYIIISLHIYFIQRSCYVPRMGLYGISECLVSDHIVFCLHTVSLYASDIKAQEVLH